jgi:peptidoglycan-associated lipoprotein
MNRTVSASVVSVLALGLVVGACAKRPTLTAATAPAPGGQAIVAVAPAPVPPLAVAPAPPNVVPAKPEPVPPATSPPAPVGPAPAPVPERPVVRDFAPVAELKMIHFEFDRSDIRPGDARILDANAEWLRANPRRLVLIEGHCDERGTNEYNLALGERRAKSTVTYLASRSIAADRMTIISYGEERPLCTQHAEACWSKNRRAQFLAKEQ